MLDMSGTFFLYNTEEFYIGGKIIGKLSDSHYLLQIGEDNKDYNQFTQIVHVNEFTEENSMGPVFRFFKTEKDLEKYYDWLSAPSSKEEKVIKLISNNKQKDFSAPPL